MTKKITKQVRCKDIEGKTYTVPVSDLTFRPAVYGIIIQGDKILLTKQLGGYEYPGGGVELGETIQDGLIREVKEETGYDVEVGKILDCDNSFFKLPYVGDFTHSIRMYFECDIIGGRLSNDFLDDLEKQYILKSEWIDIAKVKDIKLFSTTDPVLVLKKCR